MSEELISERNKLHRMEQLCDSLQQQLRAGEVSATENSKRLTQNLEESENQIKTLRAHLLDSEQSLESASRDANMLKQAVLDWKQMHHELEEVIKSQKIQSNANLEDLSSRINLIHKEQSQSRRDLRHITELVAFVSKEVAVFDAIFQDENGAVNESTRQDMMSSCRSLKKHMRGFGRNHANQSLNGGLSISSMAMNKIVSFICDAVPLIVSYKSKTNVLNTELFVRSEAMDSASSMFADLEGRITHSANELLALDNLTSDLADHLQRALQPNVIHNSYLPPKALNFSAALMSRHPLLSKVLTLISHSPLLF